MKIWVTGANGQLGQEFRLLSQKYSKQYTWYFSTSSEADITDNEKIDELLETIAPNYIINCAAYTKVDKAEGDREKCFEVNVEALNSLAKKSVEIGTALIHFSSDYVFDGAAELPYTENCEVNPLNIYGSSKAKGDAILLQANISGIIFRSSWIYSQFGHNFLKTMLRLGAEKENLNVVKDQISCPTNAADLAKAVLKSIENGMADKPMSLLNFTNLGIVTWFNFAQHIMKAANLPCKVIPIPTSGYPLPAKRPKYSLLALDNFVKKMGYEPRCWKDAVDDCINSIKTTNVK